MILQALVDLYEDLVAQGKAAQPGWGMAKISYALCIDGNGQLTDVVSLQEERQNGTKTKLAPRMMELPAPVKRSSDVAANFLWDNASYLLGIDSKGKPERSRKCFETCRQLHHTLLDNVDSPTARAILAYFDSWQPLALDEPILSGCMDALLRGVYLVFRVNAQFPQDDPAIRAAWQAHYDAAENKVMQCLVTGMEGPVEKIHPSIQGVRGAQSSGAALVSFNAPAFCSYGQEQSLNAPVGRYAAFAYTTALNHLLSDRNSVQLIGDMTVICWAKGAEPIYQSFSSAALFGASPPAGLRDADLQAALQSLADMKPYEGLPLDPKRPFYVLGLAPNAARLSVRFFLQNTFGAAMKNIWEHHERTRIVGPDHAEDKLIPLWALMRQTANQKSKDKQASPVLAGAVTRSIYAGTPYPAALLEAVTIRIRAERDINWQKAAILKAYYLKYQNKDCPKEVLQVSLNEASTNPYYTLGRLFAVYEAIQEAANPGINATIKDKYFNAAAATPAMIFPVLDNLCQKHLRKLSKGQRINMDKQVGQLKDILSEEYPLRLTLPQQGSFNLGYYHQKQKRFEKKEDK